MIRISSIGLSSISFRRQSRAERRLAAFHGDDPAFRPNQIFAIALEHSVLDREYWKAVVTAVHAKLVTPVGLRSLAPGEPEYKPRYFGDLRAMPHITGARCGLG